MLLESSATSAGAIDMGRLSKTTAAVVGRPSFRVHYRKLVDEYSATQCDVLKFVPSLPDYLSYCCHQCGHTQKLQVIIDTRPAGMRKRPIYEVSGDSAAVYIRHMVELCESA